jgi:hypothetical protein
MYPNPIWGGLSGGGGKAGVVCYFWHLILDLPPPPIHFTTLHLNPNLSPIKYGKMAVDRMYPNPIWGGLSGGGGKAGVTCYF